MIPAGELRHVISIQARTSSTDEYGGTVFTWADYASNVRAKKSPLRGRQVVSAASEKVEATDVFSIRYIDGVEDTMRIVCDGQYHDIVHIADVKGMGRVLEITTKTGASTG